MAIFQRRLKTVGNVPMESVVQTAIEINETKRRNLPHQLLLDYLLYRHPFIIHPPYLIHPYFIPQASKKSFRE
jgi:hypothetical protein